MPWGLFGCGFISVMECKAASGAPQSMSESIPPGEWPRAESSLQCGDAVVTGR